MPKAFYTLAPVADLSLAAVNRMVSEIQRRFDELSAELGSVQGYDGVTPVIRTDVDMNGKRLMNGALTQHDGDVPTRGELVDRALYARHAQDVHVTARPIHATAGVKVPHAVDAGFALPLGQAQTTFLAVAGTGTVSGSPTFSGSASFTGTITSAGTTSFPQTTPAAIAANTNNYNPGTATYFRLSATAPFNVTGLAGGSDGRVVIFSNVGANAITLTNEDALSTNINRFHFSTGGNLVLAVDGAITLIYDATTQRWRDTSFR